MSQYDYQKRDDDRHIKQVLIDITDGDGIPECVSDGDGGIDTPDKVTADVCRVIRQLRPTLTNAEVRDLLGYTLSTVSYHSRGIRSCHHSEEESGPVVTSRNTSPRRKTMDVVTDHDTMVVTGSGSSTFHRNADGEPACGRGHRGTESKDRGDVRDPIQAYIWKDPCKECFPRWYDDDEVPRRIAEIEYELAKRGQRNLIKDQP